MPSFYVDVWKSFYMCKTIRNVKCINNFDFLSSIIWGNNMFINKTGKCIFFVNWIKSDIIFVKDLYDENGIFITENYIINTLKDKSNWIAEYYIIKSIFKNYEKCFDTSLAKFVNVKSSVCNIPQTCSKDFYKKLVQTKSKRHYMEKRWNIIFNKDYCQNDWANIYKRKIKYSTL